MDWIGFDQIRQNDISDRLDQIRYKDRLDGRLDRSVDL